MPKHDLTGMRFGRLQVVARTESNKGRSMWLCQCICGKERVVAQKYLRDGRTRSCGCLRRDQLRERSTTHGLSASTTYQTWSSIRSRCYNTNQGCYEKYGASGITVCDRWLESFENFLEDMGERPKNQTLDRKDPFGNYEPSNCRWATPAEQARNRRVHLAIEFIESAGLSDEFEEFCKNNGKRYDAATRKVTP